MNWHGRTGMLSRTKSFDADSSSLQRSKNATEAADRDDPGCLFAEDGVSFDGSNRKRRNPAPWDPTAASIGEKQGRQGAADSDLEPARHDRENYEDRSQSIHEISQERTVQTNENDLGIFEDNNRFFRRLPEGIPTEIEVRHQSHPKPRTESMANAQRRNPIEQSNLRYRYVKLAMSMRRTDLSRRQLLYQNVHALVLANLARWRLRRRVLAGLLSGRGGAPTDQPERGQGRPKGHCRRPGPGSS